MASRFVDTATFRSWFQLMRHISDVDFHVILLVYVTQISYRAREPSIHHFVSHRSTKDCHWCAADVSHWSTAVVSHWSTTNDSHWSTADISQWSTANVSHWSTVDVSHRGSVTDGSRWSTADISHWSTSDVSPWIRSTIIQICELET